MDFRFVHAADLHLDSPFKGLDVDATGRRLMEEATFEAFRRIVGLCLEVEAAFLVLAGDLFESRDRSVRARLALATELARLDARGIRTFIVHGNHDPLMGRQPGSGLPASVKVFGPEWEEVEVWRDGAVVCRVQGISYAQSHVTSNLSQLFRRTGSEFSLGVLHANVGGVSEHAPYAPCTLGDLDERGLDYWALGHVHTRAVHVLSRGGVAVYPGNPQGRHIQEDGPRGCALVSVRDGQPHVRFVDVDVVRWHRLALNVAGVPTLEELECAVQQLCDVEVGVSGGTSEGQRSHRAHVARLHLTGRGPVHQDLRDRFGRDQLAHALRDSLFMRSPPWILERLEDETGPELDLPAIQVADGLCGTVLRLAEEAEREVAARDELWSDEPLRRLEVALRKAGIASPRNEPGLIAKAGERVVEGLLDGEGS